MKNNYSFRHIMALLSFFYCCSGNLFAQTMPTPRKLVSPSQPIKEDFEKLDAASASYADIPGFQGWTANGANQNTANYNTGLTGDRPFIKSSSVGNNSGGIHNYKGKIGFLNTTTGDFTIGFAFSTLSNTTIKVEYDAMVIRNPYDGTSNNRLQEMALQYRVGETGGFIDLQPTPTSIYSNNSTTPQITGTGTDPVDNKTTRISVTLPSDCDNKPIVQIRWIARLISGTAGSRQSFAIDNLEIGSGAGNDVTAPVSIAGYPKADNILGESFDFSNKLDEIGKTYYVLLPSGSAQPTIAQLKLGQDATGTAALQSGILDITNATQAFVKNFAGLSLGTAYSVFSVSEDTSGNIQSTVNKVDVTTSNVPTPVISTTKSSLYLGAIESTYTSETLSYQIQALNLTSDVVLTSTGNFTISKDNTTFGSSLTFTVADLASNATPTVYVKFTPNTVNSFSGQITHTTTGGVTKTVALTGDGIDPYKQNFNNPNVLTNSGWTQFNLEGPLNKWVYTTAARNINSSPGAVLVNGYSDAGASKDWLISPKLRLNNFTQIPLLSFYSRKYYEGPSLKLMVSTNYDGVSNPENATWTELNGKFPTFTGGYVQTQFIDLSAYKTDHTYVAWVYETTAGATDLAAEWSLDDFLIANETTYLDSNPILDFGDVVANAVSASQSFVLNAKGYGDLTITAPADYQLSLDNTTFQSSIIVAAADAANGKTLYARFTPSVKTLTISGTLKVTGTSLDKQIGSFTGSSIPKADTFDIVTYNLEFFGTDVIGSDGKEFGPTNDPLQVENVAKVMNKLNADVYVVQEVSDEPNLNELIKKISINGKTFDKSISTSWSYSFNAPQADFPPQKLVVLYNTQTTTVKSTKVLFKDLYDQVRAGTVILPNYPGTATPAENDDSFFSSGRLPYLVKIETNIGGITKEINVIDFHARANSGTNIEKYNQRKYDVEYLKQALDTEYPNSNLIILGDFNDDVKAWVGNASTPSSYKVFVDDTANYNTLTLGISQAGTNSYFNFTPESFLDHIIISNELSDQYIPNSISVYDPRNDIPNYITTTSDHGPVIARFDLKAANLSTIDFENKNGFYVQAFPNPTTDVVNVVVKSKNDKNLKLKFYDITGHLVGNPVEINATQDLSTTAIPVGYLQTGIYVYTLSENNKVVYKGKIIKK